VLPGGHSLHTDPSFLPWHGSYDHSFVVSVLFVVAAVMKVVVGSLVVVVVVVLDLHLPC